METTKTVETTLNMKRVVSASRKEVFQAWTDPERIKQWFHIGKDWTTPIAEVDLKVGGNFRLVMKPPDSDTRHTVNGVYREIRPPEKLVFTWSWAGENPIETLVTIKFRELGNSTEVELTHEQFPNSEERDKHNQGWVGCLEQLTNFFQST